MKTQILGLAAASLITFSAQALDLSYHYANVEYNSYDEADGFTFGGSYDMQNDLYGFAELALLGDDTGTVDNTFFQLGGGYIYALDDLAPKTDLIFEVSYLSQDTDDGNNSVDDASFAIGIGIRHMVSPEVELRAKLENSNLFDESNTTKEFGGTYFPDKQYGIGATYSTNDVFEGFSLTGRYMF